MATTPAHARLGVARHPLGPVTGRVAVAGSGFLGSDSLMGPSWRRVPVWGISLSTHPHPPHPQTLVPLPPTRFVSRVGSLMGIFQMIPTAPLAPPIAAVRERKVGSFFFSHYCWFFFSRFGCWIFMFSNFVMSFCLLLLDCERLYLGFICVCCDEVWDELLVSVIKSVFLTRWIENWRNAINDPNVTIGFILWILFVFLAFGISAKLFKMNTFDFGHYTFFVGPINLYF